jgi:hypothetical protein
MICPRAGRHAAPVDFSVVVKSFTPGIINTTGTRFYGVFTPSPERFRSDMREDRSRPAAVRCIPHRTLRAAPAPNGSLTHTRMATTRASSAPPGAGALPIPTASVLAWVYLRERGGRRERNVPIGSVAVWDDGQWLLAKRSSPPQLVLVSRPPGRGNWVTMFVLCL